MCPRSGSGASVKTCQRNGAARSPDGSAQAAGQCGKYLTVSRTTLLDGLEPTGELTDGKHGCCPGVRVELEGMSAATIDIRTANIEVAEPGCTRS